MKRRTKINQWWELMAANGDRVEAAAAPYVGTGEPERFTREDVTRRDHSGRTEIDHQRQLFEEHGPLELVKVTRYRLVRNESMAEELEDILPPDCIICGWGLPGPHAKGCKMGAFLRRLDKMDTGR